MEINMVCLCLFRPPFQRTAGLSFYPLDVVCLLLLSCFVWYVTASCWTTIFGTFKRRLCSTVQLINSHSHHTFHLHILTSRSPAPSRAIEDCVQISIRATHVPCRRAGLAHESFVNLTYTPQESLAESLEHIYDMVPEISLPTRNSTYCSVLT